MPLQSPAARQQIGDASKINRPGAAPHQDCELLPVRTVEVPVNHHDRTDPQLRSQPALYSTNAAIDYFGVPAYLTSITQITSASTTCERVMTFYGCSRAER